MKRILITGSNSFIGNNFRRFSKFKEIEEISVRDSIPFDNDFHNFDVVLHLAAIVHQNNKALENEYYSVNRDLCLNVAMRAKQSGVKHFIFMSSVKVYGRFIPDSDPWNEDSPCFPDDPYGKSKYEAELGLKKLEDSDFIVSIIRTPIVYGTGVKANMLKIVKLVDNFPFLPFLSVNNNRHYTYVENLVGFIDIIIEIRAAGTFIVMDDTPLSTLDLVKYVSNFLNQKIILFRLPVPFVRIGIALLPGIFDRLYGSFYLNNTKTKKVLNYTPPFTTEEGLCKMISSYKESKKKKNMS